MSSMLILSKNAVVPATPAADKIGIYVDSNELLSFILDTGIVRTIPAQVATATFTPAISFGGGVTGLTYTTQVGRYERIGARVFFEVYIVLSNKGSSSGVALVTGLPVGANAAANANQAVTLRLDAMSSISGSLQAFIAPSGTTIRLEHLGTGTAAQLTEANFTNTSSIMVTGVYES